MKQRKKITLNSVKRKFRPPTDIKFRNKRRKAHARARKSRRQNAK